MTSSVPWVFVLERQVVKHRIDGHHGGVGPFLSNLWVRSFGGLKHCGFPSKAGAKLVNPVAGPQDLRKMQVHSLSRDHETLPNGGPHLSVNFQSNCHRRLSFVLRQVTVP